MSPRTNTKLTLVDHWVGALLGLVYVVLLLSTSHGIGMSRDETFYVHAADSYGRWFEMLWEDPQEAVKRENIDKLWEYNHEHPALLKSAFGISNLAQAKWQIFDHPSMAYRFPGMLCGGLLLWLLYLFGTLLSSRPAGVFAAMLFACIPRVFYHAQLACFDLPIVFFIVLTTYCYYRSLAGQKRWLIALGIAYGLALATKHNAWVVPGIFGIHAWWRSRVRIARGVPRKPLHHSIPGWLVAMVVIGIPVFVISWPWLWNDGLERFGWYAGFHFKHVHYDFAYLGTTYYEPPFPIHLPFVSTAFTVPFGTIALGLIGMAFGMRRLLPPKLAARFRSESLADPYATYVLLIGSCLAPMVVIAMPQSPIFGGTKHWMAAYPFLVLFAGIGFDRVREILAETLEHRAAQPILALAFATLMMISPALETAHARGFGLSYYSPLAGGTPGAADLGMNRQFWGFTHGHLSEWIKQRLPKGGSVWLCDATPVSWSMLQRDGRIPSNVRTAYSLSGATLALVHHEHHFSEVEAQIWTTFGTVRPVHVVTLDGVPIISVYENPKRRPKH